MEVLLGALSKVDDTKLGETVELFGGRQGPRAFALIALTNDWADHYTAAAMYLRLNGLLPPTAREKKQNPFLQAQKPSPGSLN